MLHIPYLCQKKVDKKKPDAVAWDDKTARYIAKILPYATSISGPKIELADVDAFKRKGIEKATKILKAEWEELQRKLQDFATAAATTERVYAAKYKFEPIVGVTYYLYENASGDFLSIIPPEQWKQKFVGPFALLQTLSGKLSQKTLAPCPNLLPILYPREYRIFEHAN